MIVSDERGRLVHEPSPVTTGLAGRRFRRREARDGWASSVVVTGVTDTGDADRGPVLELVLESADFGELVDGFDAIASIDFETFAEDYVELSGADVAVLAAEQAVVAAEATKVALENGELSTWRMYA